MSSCSAVMRLLIGGALVGGIALRLVYLDADPDYYAWIGYITDEGRWLTHARELALFGRILNTDWLLHLLLAPAFQAIGYVSFKLMGVSLWSARLPTALAGSLILVLFWLLLRRAVTGPALLVGLLLLAFDVDLIELSRVSIPEMAAMLALLAVYGVVVTEPLRPYRALAGGLLLALAIGIKATVLPAVAIFSVIILVQAREEARAGRREQSLLMLWAGLLAPALALLLAEAVCCRGRSVAALANIRMLGRFLKPAHPYDAVSFFFDSPLAPTVNIWGAAACFALLGWLMSASEPADARARRYFVSAGIWCALYVLLMLSIDYFPDRYKAHLLLPLAIVISTGISLAQTAIRDDRTRALAALPPGKRVAATALLALPAAVLWAPMLAGVASLVGMDTTRLSIRLACVATAFLVTAQLARRHALAGRSPRIFIIFPVVAILDWTVFDRLGLDKGGFWPVPGAAAALWWAVGIPAAVGLALLFGWVGRRWTPPPWFLLATVAALCYSALGVARILPAYVSPHYSIKQTSQALGVVLADSPGLIATSAGEGLFNGNTLPYRTVLGRTWPANLPDVIVIVFHFNDRFGLLGREYQLAASYRLFVSPAYSGEESGSSSPDREETVLVYRRRPAARAEDAGQSGVTPRSSRSREARWPVRLLAMPRRSPPS